MTPRSVSDVIRSLLLPREHETLSWPGYSPTAPGTRYALGVGDMRDHMTDEGFQLFKGLESSERYETTWGEIDVADLVTKNPGVVVLQDKREWEGRTAERRHKVLFSNVGELKKRPDIFKLTVLKDAQHDPEYNRNAADEIGCHAWIVYYHPRIVKALAPYVRQEHLVRTYHTLDKNLVLPYGGERPYGCLLSGAVSGAYPLRTRLAKGHKDLYKTVYLAHPGYHQRGCETPRYLGTLSRFKVAICTSSIYGYALRKIIEATACGCVVITDLPTDDVLPKIDGNLVRVSPDISVELMSDVIKREIDRYDPELQEMFGNRAKQYYDYRETGKRLADNIERMRLKCLA